MASPFGGALPSDSSDECDQHRVAPYLLRYYVSVSNPRASALTDEVFGSLVGQITWPRGSLRRATAALKAHGHPATGELPEFLRENHSDEDQVDLRVVPTNDVDAKLSQHIDFKSGLKALYADEPKWLRDVLRNSLPAAEARQDQADGLMWTRLQQVGQVFGWTPAELQLARIAMHASEIAELAEWLDTLPMIGRDAARAYKRVVSADVTTLRLSLRPNGHLNCCGLFIVDRAHDRPLLVAELQLRPPMRGRAMGFA